MVFTTKKHDLVTGFPPFLNNFLNRISFPEVLPMAEIRRGHVDSCRVLTTAERKLKVIKALSYVWASVLICTKCRTHFLLLWINESSSPFTEQFLYVLHFHFLLEIKQLCFSVLLPPANLVSHAHPSLIRKSMHPRESKV